MNLSEHPAIHWFFLKWPKWVKIASATVGVLGIVGSIMGWGGQIMNAIRSRDTKLQVEAVARQLDKERDDKVEATLAEHGKAIEATKVGVQQIENHLAKQDVEVLGTKEQLNRIETAIISANAPRIALPTATP